MAKSSKFGTFGGVFTPSILTILGVIMYLRLPMIVGEAGLFATIGIIVIAHIISATTGLSVSSIATDKKVKAGGTYYMISRSLGLPIGGTLGLALFVGLSFSVSLYLIGFSESFLNYWGLSTDINSIRITGSIILLVVTTITFISTSLAIKSQYFIMAAIFLSLVSILMGKHDISPERPLLTNPESTIPLMVLFGIFFPAVTGFEAGVSMSGDLKDPKKSIPKGSIMAILIGFIVYILLAFFFSYTVSGEALINDPRVLLNISWIPELVIIGIWGATLSSALGSILGAPRILQATAVDKITPKIFSKGVGSTNEPRNALILTFFIAWIGILIGELNVIARIVSIFFISTYGFLNLSCAIESWTSPDFRPTFKAPVWVSLLGSVACFVVMIQLDFVAMLGASVILGFLFLYLKRKELSLQSGDTWTGFWASLVKSGLERLSKENLETRNWRPNIILFVGNKNNKSFMLELARSISGKLGMLTSFELIESDKPLLLKPTRDLEEEDKNYFHHIFNCRDPYSGMEEISRVYGFSGIEPNTIMMGWAQTVKHKEKFVQLIEGFKKNDYNSVFLSYSREKKYGNSKTIDIWWNGSGRNLALAVNLLRHITSSSLWKQADIHLKIINPDNTQTEKVYKTLEKIIANFRIEIEIKIINNGIDQLPDEQIIERESKNTDLTLIGIPDEQYDSMGKTYARISQLAQNLGTTIFINASSVFDEYNIALGTAAREKAMNDEVLVLPEIKESRYSEIASDINKIDLHGKKLINVFYNKSFKEYFTINRAIDDDLEAMIESVNSSLSRIKSIEDGFRTARAITKIRSEFYFRSNKIFEKLIEEQLDNQRETLEAGINWYTEQLDKNIHKFPKKLTIMYPKEDLKIKKDDPGRIKWIKFKRKATHPFSKNQIPGKIHYREIAQYYLRDNRHHFLSAFLEQFKLSSFSYLERLQQLINLIDNQFDLLDNKMEEDALDAMELEKTTDLFAAEIEKLKRDQERVMNLYGNRLLVEYRKNLKILNSDLEKLDINRLIKQKRRGKSFYHKLKEENLAFAQNWFDEAKLVANKNFLDILILTFRDRVYHEAEEFNQAFALNIDNKFLKTLEEIREQIYKIKSSRKKNLDLKLPKIPSDALELISDFEERGKKLLHLAMEMPEKITISTGISSKKSDEDEEIIDIPVNRIVQHFLESEFLGPGMEHLRKSSEIIKNLVFNLNDLLSLARFSIDNIDKDIKDEDAVIKETVDNTLKNIDLEEKRVKELKENTIREIEKLLDELFTSLSSFKIHESTKEFSYLVRDYKSKKVLTRFGRWSQATQNFFKENIVKILYSRSEGVLLAQRFSEVSQQKTFNEKILDVLEEVSPNQKILHQLPHYYQNLFSGRSSIGENFWIKRPVEENAFKKAIERYRNGHKGAILILGERNSGKTSFTLQVCKKHFTQDKVYHVFLNLEGTVNVDDLVFELQKSTMISGGLENIMNSLPAHSALVFHDLELWWKRTPDGLKAIEMFEWLVNTYSEKILFIFNGNPFAYEVINKIHPIESLFISTIRSQPFDSEDLKNLVISRHRSSGLEFSLDNKGEKRLSDIRIARLFNDYFNYSDGNPGVTMNAWLANIQNVSADKLIIKTPEKPNIKIFEEIPDDWKILLLQLIIHKRLSSDQLSDILGIKEKELQDTIVSLSRTGILNERNKRVYSVNPYIEPFLIKYYKQNSWL